MPRESGVEAPADVGPLRCQDAEEMNVACRPVGTCLEVPQDPVAARAKRQHGLLRPFVQVVHAESHDGTAERVECVAEQQPLARRVDVCPLPPGGVERIANLDAIDWPDDVVEAGGADDEAGRQLADDPHDLVGFDLDDPEAARWKD